MKNIQKAKVEYTYDGNSVEIYFVDQAFVSAYKQAEDFIKRNKGKFLIKLYHHNFNPYGALWLYQGTH